MKKNSEIWLAITAGDPAGIGPEVIVNALSELMDTDMSFAVIGSPGVMEEAMKRFGGRALKRQWERAARAGAPGRGRGGGRLVLVAGDDLPMSAVHPGSPGKQEGRAAWRCMEAGLDLVINGRCDALVTAPVSKASLMAAGFTHPGHTDWLGRKIGARPVMMLVSRRLRVAAATVHVPLAEVAGRLSRKLVLETIVIVESDLRQKFRIARPRITVAGLNPHAGEDGRLGREEKEIIEPAIADARARGVEVTGPLPADTLFTPAAVKGYDAAVCMYHDQAMIAVKTRGMEKAVNVTLGLPLIRTSPGHGTAPDIAWQGKADPSAMIEAVKLAARLAAKIKKHSRGS